MGLTCNSHADSDDINSRAMIQLLFLHIILLVNLQSGGIPDPEGPGVVSAPPDCRECHGNLLEKAFMHYPAEDACDNCHESTGASHPSDSVGFRLMDASPALCFYCHEELPGVAHEHQPVSSGHCLSCHDPHGSAEASLLHFSGPQLCLGCHNRTYRNDSTETVNISRLVRGSGMVVHTAITELGCTTCHQAHGSGFRDLLVETYPADEYVPATTEQFGLCFLCHDTDLLDAEETEWATGFRQGTLNLHRIHIQGNKGRNCRLCHNLHGSPNPFLVEDRVAFGRWEMNLNFVPEERGGSCLPGCHGLLSYRR